MTKWGKKTPSGMQWPAEWDENENWASTTEWASEAGLKREPRSWALLGSLSRRGLRLGQIIEELGGPEARELDRTIDQCDQEILAYFKKTGKKPTDRTPGFNPLNHWLRKQGTSLSLRCDELGLPALLNNDRTMDQCDQEILAYYKKTGKRPTQRTSSEFGQWNDWLRRQSSSLFLECNKLGLPGGPNFERTMDRCDQEILAYYKKTGKRPTDKTPGFKAWNHWLRNHHNSSLSQRCDKLELPILHNLDRTIDQCDQEILAYYKKTGKRPTKITPGFDPLNQWLRKQGTSLSLRCNKLGLNNDRTMDQCDQEILAYYKKTGKRPTTRTLKEFTNWNAWLFRRGTSLFQRCNKLGLK